MKSMILKDCYNVLHNVKHLVLLMLFMAFCLIPTGGPEGFVVCSAVLCASMTITTFSYDERCKWDKFAMIMPVSRKEYVKAKYMMNLMFGIVGVGFGAIFAAVGGVLLKRLDVLALLGCLVVGILFNILFGSICIPMIIKFGTENARLIMLGSVALPALLYLGGAKLLETLHIEVTQQMLGTLVILVAAFLLFLILFSYRFSVKCFERKEF